MSEHRPMCVTSSRSGASPERILTCVHQHGLDGAYPDWSDLRRILDVCGIDPSTPVKPTSEPGDVRIVGLTVSALSARTDDEMERITDDIYMQMRVAHNLGLSGVSIMGGGRDALSRDRFVDGLRRVSELAARLGLRVRLRNAHGSCLESCMDIDRVLGEISSEAMEVDADMGEFHLASVNPCDPMRAFASLVTAVRLWDVARRTPVALGNGEINAEAVTRTIVEAEGPRVIVLTLGADAEAEVRLAEDVRFCRSRCQ